MFERLKLRHLQSVSLQHACPDPEKLLRSAAVRDEMPTDGVAVMELERVGLQVAVYCVHADACRDGDGAKGCIARGDAFLCYRTEIQWGSLSPEFAPIARDALPYIAANGALSQTLSSRGRA